MVKRPDVIIMDDLENDELKEPQPIRKKLRSWLNKAVIPAAHTDCKFFLIGTVLHEDSLLNNLLHRFRVFLLEKILLSSCTRVFSQPLLGGMGANITE